MTAVLIIELITVALATIITVNTANNLRAYRRLGTFAADARPDLTVSVLIPARNEARSIAACVESLARQDHPAREIIVLDDGSDDETAAIVQRLASVFPNVRLIGGAALPLGWFGKAFACHQLAAEAVGDVLLFTDADTIHAPQMLRSVLGAIAGGADIVTAFPEQEIGSWGEALSVPFMLFMVWAFLPVGRVWADRSPRFVAANGQLIACTRAAYARVGGHATVRDSVLDDVDFARHAKGSGLHVRLTDGVGTVRTRMYRGTREVWHGYSKNALALIGGRVWSAVLFAVALLVVYVLPILMVVVGIVLRRGGWLWLWLPCLGIALTVVQRTIVVVRSRMPIGQIALHPINVLCFLAILANSIRWRWRGYGEWKGRVIRSGRPVAAHEAPEQPE